MNQSLKQVDEFHRTFGAPVLDAPAVPSHERIQLRLSLILEELHELAVASGAEATFIDMLQSKVAKGPTAPAPPDLTECMDALCDLQVVLNGSILEYGLHPTFDEAFAEVHRSNMSKACNTEAEAQASVNKYQQQGVEAHYKVVNGKYVIYRSHDHKILKGVNFTPPSLAGYSGHSQ